MASVFVVEGVGVYSTLELAEQAAELAGVDVPYEFELDAMPEPPEPYVYQPPTTTLGRIMENITNRHILREFGSEQ